MHKQIYVINSKIETHVKLYTTILKPYSDNILPSTRQRSFTPLRYCWSGNAPHCTLERCLVFHYCFYAHLTSYFKSYCCIGIVFNPHASPSIKYILPSYSVQNIFSGFDIYTLSLLPSLSSKNTSPAL